MIKFIIAQVWYIKILQYDSKAGGRQFIFKIWLDILKLSKDT